MAEFTTLAEAHSGPDAGYYGDQGDWIIVAARNRDSDVMTLANFDAAMREYSREGVPEEQTDISRSGHWAVGWIEYFIVRDTPKNREIASEIADAIEGYPVLDDELLGEYEREEARKQLELLIDDQTRESPILALDNDVRDRVIDALSEADTNGHWTSDLAYPSGTVAIFARDRGSADRRRLAWAMRHARHATTLSIWECECHAAIA